MDLSSLIEILKKAQTVNESICRLKKVEQNALALGDSILILETAVELNELADEASSLETERLHITAAIAAELGMEQREPTLKELVAALPVYNRTELEMTGKALLDTVQEVQNQNQASAHMLERSMNTLTLEIAKLSQTGESGVYNANGKRKTAPPLRAGLNVRI